jgi:NAD(P)-dependent dehydrogenase (short-subunit alcohol dehydrogenase family)
VIALDLDGKVALVTGASGGIGAGIARRLGAAGAEVVAHHRSDRHGAAAVAPRTVGGDLTVPGAARRLLDEVGPVDIVVHNAADQRLGELAAARPEDWREIFAVNVEAVAELTREAAARMIAAGRPGSFVMIASIEGLQPAPAHGPYAASKSALLMYTRAAAAEYGRHGIRCNAVCPGLIDRPGLGDDWPEGVARWRATAPLERLGTAADVGDAVAFLASDLAAWVTGATLVVDGGVLARPTW